MKSQNPSYKAGVISISQTRKLRHGEVRNLPYVKGQQMFSVIGQMVSISGGPYGPCQTTQLGCRRRNVALDKRSTKVWLAVL